MPESDRAVASRADFWRFVEERDQISRRREAGEAPPWTDDPILRDYHFTNVHRWKDPGTRWIVDRVAEAGMSDPDELLFAVVAYRGLNRRETFERWGLPPTTHAGLRSWLTELRTAQRAGTPVGSPRHLTFMARLELALPVLLDANLGRDVWEAEDGVEAVRVLINARLQIGPFLGTQVVDDLVTIPSDTRRMTRETMVPLSAGSYLASMLLRGGAMRRGPNYEHSREGRVARLFKPDRDREFMAELLPEQPSTLSEPLTYVDVEHCLCEFARYHRLKTIGTGDGLLRRTCKS